MRIDIPLPLGSNLGLLRASAFNSFPKIPQNSPAKNRPAAPSPLRPPAKAPQTTPNHSTNSLVRNKAIPSGPRLAYLMV